MTRSGAERDICILKYRTYDDTITIKDSNGDPVDLTGFTVNMDIKLSFTSSAVVSLTEANGGIVMGDANGTIQFLISDTDTGALTSGYYVYDVELVNESTGKSTDLLYGTCRIQNVVTE